MVAATASSRVRRSTLASSDAHTRIGSDKNPDLLQTRKRELALQRLKLAREIVQYLPTEAGDSWRVIIQEVLDAGIDEATLESELAASRNTIYKWKNGLSSPREMTRRLLKKALMEVLDRLIVINDNDRS